MNEERWEQMKRLCEAARELAPDERAAWLAEACAGDEALRREVESLLEYAPRADAFIEQPAFKLFAHEMSPSLLGWQFGHYRIKALLGVGGMGEVYKAQDTKLGRAVAIKFLPGEFTSDAERVRRFEQEAYAASSLNHPYIVTVYEIGQVEAEDGARHYIAYELIEGQTLRRLLQQTKLVWPEAVRIVIQIAEALKAAHEAGIVHRDIKPENVMLRPDGRVKVLDFGIAKRFNVPNADVLGEGQRNGAGNAANTTLTGGLLGTPKYLSPEQARLGQVDEGTDIFALGLMLYEMLAGRHPFADKSSAEIIAAELVSDRELPALEVKDLPAALTAIVSKAVRKARAERYSSIGQMLDALNEFKPALEGRMAGKLQGMQALVKTQNANRLLNQFVSLYAVDERTRLSPLALWMIWRYSNIKRGKLESTLLRRSLASACWKAMRIAVPVGLLTLVLAAFFSVEEKWDERVLRDGHTEQAIQMALSPDGRTLVSVSYDDKVIVWDVARRERLATLTEHLGDVAAVAFAPSGKWFATAGADERVIVWDAKSFAKIAILSGCRGNLESVGFTPDERFFVAPGCNSHGQRLHVWKVGAWQKVGELNTYGAFLISPDGRLLVSSSATFDLATGEKFAGEFVPNWNRGAFSPDATRFMTVDGSGFLDIWDVSQFWRTGERRLLNRLPAHRDRGRAVAYSPDGQMIATGGESVIVWDARTFTKLARFAHKSRVNYLVFSNDARQVISAHGDGSILIWDIAEKEPRANLAEHCAAVRVVRFSPDGKYVASASEDGSIIVWDATLGLKKAVLLEHHTQVSSVAFAPDGKRLASIDLGGTTIVWDIDQHARVRTLAPVKKRGDLFGSAVAVSPDGQWLATSFGVYALADGRTMVEFIPDASQDYQEVYDAAFSPDGRWLAGVAPNRGVLVWDVATWRLRQPATRGELLTNVSFRLIADGW